MLRVLGLDFGLPNDSRPDEMPILNIVLNHLLSAMHRGDWSLHPHFLNYPSLYFYLLAVIFSIYYWVGLLAGQFLDWASVMMALENDPGQFQLVLRWFSAVAGTAMMIGMALLARQWSRSEPVALLAALLTATSYLLVRNSHFGSVDMLMTVGITFSLWAIVRYHQQRTKASLVLACVLCGLTLGAKYPAVLLLLSLWVVLLKPFVSDERIDWAGFLHAMWKPTGVVLLVFFATTPWLLLDFPAFVNDFFYYEMGNFLKFRIPGVESGWLFYAGFTLFYGVGGLVLLFALLGLGFRLKSKAHLWEDAALLVFLLSSYGVLGFNSRVMTRYALPLLPVLLLYAAFGIQKISELLGRLLPSAENTIVWRGRRLAIPIVVALVVIAQPLALSVEFTRLMMQADTRTLARDWLLQNVPKNMPVANGPRLGMIALPGYYGQLVVSTGPDVSEMPVEIRVGEMTPRTRVINSYADLNALRQMGIRYVVTYGGLPAFANRPWEMETLVNNAAVVFRAMPLKPGINPKEIARFDPMDAFYLPYGDFRAFERPGPFIMIFDLAQPPQGEQQAAMMEEPRK